MCLFLNWRYVSNSDLFVARNRRRWWYSCTSFSRGNKTRRHYSRRYCGSDEARDQRKDHQIDGKVGKDDSRGEPCARTRILTGGIRPTFLYLFVPHYCSCGDVLINSVHHADWKALEFVCIATRIDLGEAPTYRNDRCSTSSQTEVVEVVELISSDQGGCSISFETCKRRPA